ncbi:hypothetical protein LCI18_007903 [Fusarium solani-melongenae]|uniref:Uncharacterized protein n=1 Tax=Fusarium solani subsp. cucurbitae TaxID=2747967 RepID=A0ACD3Z6T9_FUSSC|nr:hypothetical protein LCI18_007903 [Fusarium solani-melongenae]
MAPARDDSVATDNLRRDLTLSEQTSYHIDTWCQHVRSGFPAFPVVVESAKGHIITDVDGKEYIDMIAQYAVMNFGYSHPEVVTAVVNQLLKKLGFDSVATMLSGSEAVESAIKIARKWAYTHKQVPANEAWVLTCDQCYHGLTLATMPLATVVAKNFGQHVPNVGPYAPTSGKLIKYGDTEILAETFKQDGHKIAGFIVEPVQGWAG